MAVEPVEDERGAGERGFHEVIRLSRGNRHAELRVDVSGDDLFMRVRVDAGGDPEQDMRRHAFFRGDPPEGLELVGRVDDDVSDAEIAGEREIRVRLVVAVEEDLLHGKARGLRREDLTGRHAVRQQALLRDEPVQALVAQRFSGERGQGGLPEIRPEGVPVQSALGPDRVRVQQKGGRAEFLCQPDRVQSGDGQMPGFVDVIGGVEYHRRPLDFRWGWFGTVISRPPRRR